MSIYDEHARRAHHLLSDMKEELFHLRQNLSDGECRDAFSSLSALARLRGRVEVHRLAMFDKLRSYEPGNNAEESWFNQEQKKFEKLTDAVNALGSISAWQNELMGRCARDDSTSTSESVLMPEHNDQIKQHLFNAERAADTALNAIETGKPQGAAVRSVCQETYYAALASAQYLARVETHAQARAKAQGADKESYADLYTSWEQYELRRIEQKSAEVEGFLRNRCMRDRHGFGEAKGK